MPPKPVVELYAAIRRDARAGLSNRVPQHEHGAVFRTFRTVKTATTSAWPATTSGGQGDRVA